MSEPKDDPWMEGGGPAFPITDLQNKTYRGLSVRDYFAAKALQGMLAARSATVMDAAEHSAVWAYGMADAMLAERSKP